jgi:POT family proton-dependent oligopeptide transporter
LIACGYGLFTPSLVAVLNHAYQDHEHLREGGFSIYYASINVGVFLAMLVMGATAGLFGWQMAFAVAGCVQTIGLAPLLFYFRRHKELFETLRSQQRASRLANKRLEPIERDRIKVIVAFCLVSIIFWMAYNQSFSSMAIFAHDYMNKTVFGIDIPEGIFFSSQSFFLILLAPILAGLYARLQKAHRDPSPPIKTALSLVAIAICFAIMVIATWSILPHATSAHTSWAYLVTAYFFMALGEMLLAPIGLAKISRLAPRRHTALSISAWYLCIGIAFFSGGMLASYMDKMATLSKFFGFFTVITLIAGGVMALLTKKLNRLSHIHPQPTDDLPHVER